MTKADAVLLIIFPNTNKSTILNPFTPPSAIREADEASRSRGEVWRQAVKSLYGVGCFAVGAIVALYLLELVFQQWNGVNVSHDRAVRTVLRLVLGVFFPMLAIALVAMTLWKRLARNRCRVWWPTPFSRLASGFTMVVTFLLTANLLDDPLRALLGEIYVNGQIVVVVVLFVLAAMLAAECELFFLRRLHGSCDRHEKS